MATDSQLVPASGARLIVSTPGLLTLPTEILYQIASKLFLPDLQNFADSKISLSRLCQHRVLKHRRLQAFASWDYETSKYDLHAQRPKLPYWKTLLLACLREPDTVHYVTSLHGPDTCINEALSRKTFYVQQEPFFSTEECELVRQAINDSPWIQPDDEFDHLFEDNSFPGHDSQLVPEWKTLDVLAILLPMLYNLVYLDLCWDIEQDTFTTRQDYISLLQVLRRINVAVHNDPNDNPWPRLTDMTIMWMPKAIFRSIYHLPPEKAIHYARRYVDVVHLS